MKALLGFVIALIATAIVIGLSLGVIGALVAIMCWGFGIAFTWPLAIGVWAFIVLLNLASNNGNK